MDRYICIKVLYCHIVTWFSFIQLLLLVYGCCLFVKQKSYKWNMNKWAAYLYGRAVTEDRRGGSSIIQSIDWIIESVRDNEIPQGCFLRPTVSSRRLLSLSSVIRPSVSVCFFCCWSITEKCSLTKELWKSDKKMDKNIGKSDKKRKVTKKIDKNIAKK